MMKKLKTWLMVVRCDLVHSVTGTAYRDLDQTSLTSYLIVIFKPEFQTVLCYRIYSAIYKIRPRILGYLIYLATKLIYKCDIHPKAKIGSGFLLVHGFDVVIGPQAILGNDVVVFNGVTLGKKYVGVLIDGMPKVGDRCVVGTGAKLLGGITIGQDVMIGANSVVLQDIPAGATCAGVPAKIINKK